MAWVGRATPQAKRIVIDIFRHHAENFAGPRSEALISTRQIYESAIRDYNEHTESFVPKKPENMTHRKKNGKTVTKSWPPNAEHPIRSMRYLKSVVLEDLNNQGFIEKVHIKRPPDGELEQKALSAKARKLLKRNERRTADGFDPINNRLEDTVSEWLWRRRGDAKNWVEEEKKLMESGNTLANAPLTGRGHSKEP